MACWWIFCSMQILAAGTGQHPGYKALEASESVLGCTFLLEVVLDTVFSSWIISWRWYVWICSLVPGPLPAEQGKFVTFLTFCFSCTGLRLFDSINCIPWHLKCFLFVCLLVCLLLLLLFSFHSFSLFLVASSLPFCYVVLFSSFASKTWHFYCGKKKKSTNRLLHNNSEHMSRDIKVSSMLRKDTQIELVSQHRANCSTKREQLSSAFL